jgi:hypothetical protein
MLEYISYTPIHLYTYTSKITLSNGSVFHREEAFLVFLTRHHAYRKLSSFERHYGIEYTQLSRLFNHVSNALAVHHFDRMFDKLAFFLPRFPLYNEKINLKYRQRNNVDLPLWLRHTCGFQDSTRLKVSKPGGDHAIQIITPT